MAISPLAIFDMFLSILKLFNVAYRLSILRNGNVPCRYFGYSPVDFEIVQCRVSLLTNGNVLCCYFFYMFLLNLKGHNTQHCGHTVKGLQTEKTMEYNQSGQLRYVVKYKVRKIAKSMLKHHCYCLMFLMETTKTAVCLQTMAICHQLHEF